VLDYESNEIIFMLEMTQLIAWYKELDTRTSKKSHLQHNQM